jgi:glycosyltransferase involved in cell wall biosynthesis
MHRMNVLVLAPNYPCPGYCFSGVFNEKSARALSTLCGRVAVLVPRPYVPPLVSSFVPRWKVYADVPRHETTDGISVYRPMTPVIPRVAQAFWADRGAFLACRRVARKLHGHTRFDAIMSFDLAGSGGLAWRLARDLDLPASGWATGGDVRVSQSSSFGRSVIRALKQLDLVFYQSHELRENAAALLGVCLEEMAGERHLVLPRGIPEPPALNSVKIRKQIRTELKIPSDAVFVLNVGRISRDKGIFDLIDAISLASRHDRRIVSVVVGSCPAFDETTNAHSKLQGSPELRDRVRLLPACPPSKVWEYLCAADIFAFTSHQEGMPNSLLEAMAMAVPSVAFAIPPVREIDDGAGALWTVPPLDTKKFAEALIALADSPTRRSAVGERGQQRVRERFGIRDSMREALTRLSNLAALRMRAPHGAVSGLSGWSV